MIQTEKWIQVERYLRNSNWKAEDARRPSKVGRMRAATIFSMSFQCKVNEIGLWLLARIGTFSGLGMCTV